MTSQMFVRRTPKVHLLCIETENLKCLKELKLELVRKKVKLEMFFFVIFEISSQLFLTQATFRRFFEAEAVACSQLTGLGFSFELQLSHFFSCLL